MKRRTFLSLMGAAALTSSMMLTGCGASSGDDRKIVRIGHVQSQTHPDHLGLEAFADYINEKLGDKYRVEVYPSELLGSQTEIGAADPDRCHRLCGGVQCHHGDLQRQIPDLQPALPVLLRGSLPRGHG